MISEESKSVGTGSTEYIFTQSALMIRLLEWFESESSSTKENR